MKKTVLSTCAALALAVPCLVAAGQSWDGTWKMNVAKSKLSGATFEFTDKGNGMMHYSDATFSYDFACDGKAYTVIADRTLTCTGSAQTGYDNVYKTGNTVTGKAHRSWSADGKTMTLHGTDIRPDGTTTEYTNVDKRLSGTNGIAGKWVNTKAESAPDSVVIESKADWIKFYVPEYKLTIEGKMDGSDFVLKGPSVPPGMSTKYERDGSNKIRSTTSFNGKVTGEELLTLSADGKTMLDEEWAPGKMNEKTTTVYERQ
jgi:hypothetical protein